MNDRRNGVLQCSKAKGKAQEISIPCGSDQWRPPVLSCFLLLLLVVISGVLVLEYSTTGPVCEIGYKRLAADWIRHSMY
jgi:hypothetical protein